MVLRSLWPLVKTAVSDWIADRASSRGAAIAYYTAFSLAPLLLLVIAVAGLFLGEEAARGAVVGGLHGMIGQEAAKAIEDMIRSAADRGAGLIATLTSIVLLVVGATTVFAELQDALNQMWQAPPKKVSGLWSWLRVRALSLSLIGAIGFLLLVSLSVSTALASLGSWLTGGLPQVAVLLELVNLLISVVVTALLFAAVYKVLPDVPIAWRDVAVGAAVTSVLFHIGKYLIALYVDKSNPASSFGASGAIIVVLVWVYYSAQIFLLGAEFTKAWAHRHGSKRGEARPAGGAPPGRP